MIWILNKSNLHSIPYQYSKLWESNSRIEHAGSWWSKEWHSHLQLKELSLKSMKISICENKMSKWLILTLKKAGSYVPTAQEIACHFSLDHARVLKLLDFFKNDVGPRVKESSWAYLECLSRKWTKFDKNLQIFWGENH